MWGVEIEPRSILMEVSTCARWNKDSKILGIVSNSRLGLYKDEEEI